MLNYNISFIFDDVLLEAIWAEICEDLEACKVTLKVFLKYLSDFIPEA